MIGSETAILRCVASCRSGGNISIQWISSVVGVVEACTRPFFDAVECVRVRRDMPA